MNMLCNYNWPGNVRELRNVIENAIVFTESNVITKDILPSYLNSTGSLDTIHSSNQVFNQIGSDENMNGITIGEARKLNQKMTAEMERDRILQLLEQFAGNVSEVARVMGISRNTVYRRMKTYKIEA